MPLFTSPTPFVKSFSFPDGAARINGGCAVVVGPDQALGACPIANQDDSDELEWSDAQTAAFMAGEPVTLGWISPSPARSGSQGAYVCCWITIDNDS